MVAKKKETRLSEHRSVGEETLLYNLHVSTTMASPCTSDLSLPRFSTWFYKYLYVEVVHQKAISTRGYHKTSEAPSAAHADAALV